MILRNISEGRGAKYGGKLIKQVISTINTSLKRAALTMVKTERKYGPTDNRTIHGVGQAGFTSRIYAANSGCLGLGPANNYCYCCNFYRLLY